MRPWSGARATIRTRDGGTIRGGGGTKAVWSGSLGDLEIGPPLDEIVGIDGRAVARQYKLNHKPDVFRVYTPEIRDSLQTLCELDLKPNPVDQ